MENQHQKITGYRDLSQTEIDLMNKIKALGATLEEHIAEVAEHNHIQHGIAARSMRADASVERERLDRAQPARWVAIARTHFQEGLMALTRAVAQPTTF
jgi:hypothetical protein